MISLQTIGNIINAVEVAHWFSSFMQTRFNINFYNKWRMISTSIQLVLCIEMQ